MQNEDLKNFIHQELCSFKDFILVEVNKKFKSFDQNFKAIDQRFEAMDQRFEAMDRKFEEKLNKLESKLESLSNTVTLIEHDHGEKLSILMDYIVVNNEKHDKYDNDIKVLKNIIENHSMRIDEIEKSIKSINY